MSITRSEVPADVQRYTYPVVAATVENSFTGAILAFLYKEHYSIANNPMGAFLHVESDDPGRLTILVDPRGPVGRFHSVNLLLVTPGDFGDTIPVDGGNVDAWRIIERVTINTKSGNSLVEAAAVGEAVVKLWEDHGTPPALRAPQRGTDGALHPAWCDLAECVPSKDKDGAPLHRKHVGTVEVPGWENTEIHIQQLGDEEVTACVHPVDELDLGELDSLIAVLQDARADLAALTDTN